jgi:hypothetical protein
MLKLGAEVESWCTKCRDMRRHKVLVLPKDGKPARVTCDTCKGDHFLRPNPPQSRKSSKAPVLRRKQGLSLTDDQKATARPYQLHGVYHPGDVISHPKFGFGEVTEVRSSQRMIVLFDTTEKLLVYNTQVGG